MTERRSSRSQRNNDKRSERDLSKNKIDPNDAFCDICRTWYELSDSKAVNRHAH